MKLADKDRTIHDLTDDEFEYVITTFAKRIGFAEKFAASDGEPPISTVEEILETLALDDWPGSCTTSTELAWISEPLLNPKFEKLLTYSIFWQRTGRALRLWIGRTPYIPQHVNAILDTKDLLIAISKYYTIYLSDEERREHRKRIFRWRFKRIVVRYVPHLLVLIAMVVLALNVSGSAFVPMILAVASSATFYLIGLLLSYLVNKLTNDLLSQLGLLVLPSSIVLIILGIARHDESQVSSYVNDHEFVMLVCLAIGALISHMRYNDSIGNVIELPFWMIIRRLYITMISTTVVVTIFTYGAFRLIETVANNREFESAWTMWLVVAMAVIAAIEFLKREIEREPADRSLTQPPARNR